MRASYAAFFSSASCLRAAKDWVISALNRNLPFDQFTVEQIAGDLLPNATRDQKVATGFHRNTMTNTEGGTDDEEYRQRPDEEQCRALDAVDKSAPEKLSMDARE